MRSGAPHGAYSGAGVPQGQAEPAHAIARMGALAASPAVAEGPAAALTASPAAMGTSSSTHRTVHAKRITGEEWDRDTRYSYESYSNTEGWAG